MRPVRRNASPVSGDYSHYKHAKTELVSRIGSGWVAGKHCASYCSYCERKINTNLAVEHIEPKAGVFGKPDLIGVWHNFLLACVNCNSSKAGKQIIFDEIFLPDRDNTFVAFDYLDDGKVLPAAKLQHDDQRRAENTLALVGLDKKLRETYDQNNQLIGQDRRGQRIGVWGIAELALEDYLDAPNNQSVKSLIIKLMVSEGFFSVWMTVFSDYPDMKKRFINAMAGTEESECFDLITAAAVSPHSNQDCLPGGGKI